MELNVRVAREYYALSQADPSEWQVIEKTIKDSPFPTDGYRERMSKFFQECVDDEDLKFYEWVCNTFTRFWKPETYSYIYRHGLIDHIVITERILPLLKCGEDENGPVSFYDLYSLCLKTSIHQDLSQEDAVRYADWLMRTGRAKDLETQVIKRLIIKLLPHETASVQRLLFASKLSRHDNLVRELLCSCEECQRGYPNWKKQTGIVTEVSEETLAFFSTLGEVGLLTAQAIDSMTSLQLRDPRDRYLCRTIYPLPVIKHLWESMYDRFRHTCTLDARIQLVFDLMFEKDYKDIKNIVLMLDEDDSENWDDIEEFYGAAILHRLLTAEDLSRTNKIRIQKNIIDMLHDTKWHTDEVTRWVLIKGTQEVNDSYHQIRSVSGDFEDYARAAHMAIEWLLSDAQMWNDGRVPRENFGRAIRIMGYLGPRLDLTMSCLYNHDGQPSCETLGSAICSIIEFRVGNGMSADEAAGILKRLESHMSSGEN